MTRRRSLLAYVAVPVILLAAVASGLTACAGSAGAKPASQEEPNARVFHVDVDGRQVPCIMVNPPKAAIAITCDWGAR